MLSQNLDCDVRIHAGDFVQGSVYDVFGAPLAAAAYTWAGIYIGVLGNHEFDKGNELPVAIILRSSPDVVWLNSKVEFPAPTPAGLSMARQLDMYAMCWVSALTVRTANISDADPGTRFLPETPALRAAIDRCAQRERFVAITHQGIEMDKKLCRDVVEVDIVIGGHSHTNLGDGQYPIVITRRDGTVCIVAQAYAFGRYVGVLDVEFNDEGRVLLPASMYYPVDGRVKEDADVAAKLAKFTANLDGVINKKIATLTAEIDAKDCGCSECEMGNLVTDAMLREGENINATMALVNCGSIRSSLPKGDVTIRDILTVLPFGNVNVVMTLLGSGVLDALEYGLSALDGGGSGKFPAVGGMKVVADFSAPTGKRVKSVIVKGESLEPTKSYRLVVNDFIARGGEGYDWSSATDFMRSGRAIDKLVAEYLEDNTPYTPFIDGRMVNSAAK